MGSSWQAFVGNLAVVGLCISAWTYARYLTSGKPLRTQQALFGLFMACAIVASMVMAVQIAPGTYFDLRTALIAIAGLFGGPYAALIGGGCATVYRLLLGGAGVAGGLAGIALAIVAGLIARRIASRRGADLRDVFAVAAVGVVVRLIALVALPRELLSEEVLSLYLPMAALDFAATVMTGAVLLEIRRRAGKLELLTAALAQAPDYAYVKNARSEFAAVNDAVATLHGFDRPSKLVGKSDFDVEPNDRAQALFDAEQRLMKAGGRMEEVEEQLTDAEGEKRWFSTSKVPLFNGNGQVFGLAGVTRDITEQKALELELVQARLRAESASQAKTDFLSTMSHEIRSPLNAIIGYTYLLLDEEKLGAEIERRLRLIHSAGEMLLGIVDDVLNFSRIEAGEVELDLQPFWIREVIEGVAATHELAAAAKGLALEVQVDQTVPDGLLGDAPRVGQIVLNLVGNAVKFTERGTVLITVAATRDLADKCLVKIRVKDTGIGIPQAKLEHVFNRFAQVDGSIARRFGGSGLGLAICKRLAQLMGGSIDLVSIEGQGSTFTVSIPFGVLETASASPAKRNAPATKSMRILLADDLPSNAEIASAILRKAGHRVDEVLSGAAAIEAVEHGGYDLVLMDIQMPEMDGLTATRLIRQSGLASANVPIIAMTANVLPDQIAAFSAAGMDGHIGKPFKRSQLLEVVQANGSGSTPTPTPSHIQPDMAIYGELVELLGQDRIDDHLEGLRHAIEAISDFAPASTVSTQAHKLVSVAGMLGFTDLSNLAADIEAAIGTGADYKPMLEKLRNGRPELYVKIAVLKADNGAR